MPEPVAPSAPSTPADPSRPTASTINDDQLDQLRAERDGWRESCTASVAQAEECWRELIAVRAELARVAVERDTWRQCARQAERELARLRSLRVTTPDPRAAEGITPDGMRAYLAERGWGRVTTGTVAESWWHGESRFGLHVPLHLTASDYAKRVLILAGDLAEIEDRGALGVLTDLRAASTTADSPQDGLTPAGDSQAAAQTETGPQRGAQRRCCENGPRA